MVELTADLRHLGAGLEVASRLAPAGQEEAHGLLGDERRDSVLLLAPQPQTLAARHEHPQVRARSEDRADAGRRLEQVLEVVEHEQQPAVGDVLGSVAPGSERRADRRHDEARVADALQVHPPGAVRVGLDELGGRLQGEPRLARAAGAGERHEARAGTGDERQDVGELALTAEERRCLDGEVRLMEALDRREVAGPELVERFAFGQVLQTVDTERPQLVTGEESCGRLRHEHLPAVAGGADSRRLVDVHADVPLLGDDGRARVEAHPYCDRAGAEALLRLGGRSRGRHRIGKGDEEGIALGVDLVPPCRSNAARSTRLCSASAAGIPLRPELAQEQRGAFDVGEKERHRAPRELGHRP